MAQTLARLRKTSKGASPGHRDAGVMIQLGPHTYQSLGGGADGQALIVDSTSPTGFSLGMPATTPVVIPDEVVTTTNATVAADAAGAPGAGEKFLFNVDTGVITHYASGGAWVAMPALAPDDDEVVTTTTATLAADSAATPTVDQNFLFNTDTGEFTHYSDGSAWVPMPVNLQADEVVETTTATLAADSAGTPGAGENFLLNTDTGEITHYASGGAWVAMPAPPLVTMTVTNATVAATAAAAAPAGSGFLYNTDTGEFTHWNNNGVWTAMPLDDDEVVHTDNASVAADSAATPPQGASFLLNTDTGAITHYASGGAWVAMPAIPDEIVETDNANVAADSAAAAPAGSNFLFNTDTGAITHFNDGGAWVAFPVVTIPNEIIVVDNTTSAAVVGAAAPAGSKLIYNRQSDRATHWNNAGTWTVIPATPDRQDTRGSLNPAGGVIALPTVGGAETTVNTGEAWDIGDRYLITAAGTVGGITVGADDLPASLVFNGTGNGTADSHWTLFSGATVIGDTLEMGWNPPTLTPDAVGAIANGADANTVNGDLASWLEALNDKIDAVRYVDNFVPVDINHNGSGSIDITTALTTALTTAGYDAAAVPLAVATLTSEGVKTAAPDNIVRLIDRTSNRGIISALDNTVYGRITEAAGVYTVTYYSINPDTGAEVPAIEGGTDPYRLWIPYRFTDDSVPRAAGTNASEVDTFAGTDLGFLLGAVNQAAADSLMVPTNHAVRIGVGGNLEGAWLNVGAVPAAATAANLADPTLFAQVVVNRWREIGDATTTLAGAEYTVEGLTGPLTISNHTIGLNESVLISDQPRGLLTATNKIDLNWGGTLSLLGGQTLTSPFELDITGMTIEIINRGGGDWLGILYGSGNGAGLTIEPSSYVAGTDASGQTYTAVAGHNLVEFDISSLADGTVATPAVYELTLDTPPTDDHLIALKIVNSQPGTVPDSASETRFVRINLPDGLDGDTSAGQAIELQSDYDSVVLARNTADDGYTIISSHLRRLSLAGGGSGVTLPITLADVSDSGTAAALNVPAAAGAQASATEAVRGDDPRLDPFDASFTPLIISGTAPAVNAIPPEITALAGDDEETGDRALGRFDDYDVYYQFDGTNWTETGRAARVQAMVGATSTTAGAAGYVPAPAILDRSKFLRGDGTWAEAGHCANTSDYAGSIQDAIDTGAAVVCVDEDTTYDTALTIPATLRVLQSPNKSKVSRVGTTRFIDATGLSGLEVTGIAFESSDVGAQTSAYQIFRIDDSSDINIHHNSTDSNYHRIAEITNCDNAHFDFNTCRNISLGAYMRNCTSSTMNFNFIQDTVLPLGTFKIGIGLLPNDGTPTSGQCDGVQVIGNIIDGLGDAQGILGHGGSRTMVQHNIISGCAQGISFNISSAIDVNHDVTITDNIITGIAVNQVEADAVTYTPVSETGITLSTTGASSQNFVCRDNIISGVNWVLKEQNQGGIIVIGSDDVTVSDNEVSDCYNNGVAFSGADSLNVSVHHNRFKRIISDAGRGCIKIDSPTIVTGAMAANDMTDCTQPYRIETNALDDLYVTPGVEVGTLGASSGTNRMVFDGVRTVTDITAGVDVRHVSTVNFNDGAGGVLPTLTGASIGQVVHLLDTQGNITLSEDSGSGGDFRLTSNADLPLTQNNLYSVAWTGSKWVDAA